MRSRRRRSLLLVTFLFLAIVLVYFFSPSVQAAVTTENLSVVMVIDVSGSMSSTDPQRLRESAACIFIDLLAPEDRLGVIVFDDKAEVALPMQPVGSAAHRENIKDMLSARLTPRGYSNFLLALNTAYDQLQAGAAEGSRPVVLFLTDGEPDMPDFAADQTLVSSYLSSLWETVGRFALQGYPVYSVAFSDEIDPDIIRKISQDTAGDHYILEDAADLAVSFFDLLGTLKNRRGFLLDSALLGTEALVFDFQVGEYTRQVNLVGVNLAGRPMNLEIIPPSEEAAAGVEINLLEEDNYSLAVLSFPEGGEPEVWRAAISGSGQASIMGDMDLFIKAWLEEPGAFSQHPLGEPLNFKASITGGDYLEALSLNMEVEIKGPDGVVSHLVALAKEEGFFTGTYEEVNQEGAYEILVHVKLEDEIISTTSSRVYVKALPSLVTDFRVDEGFRLGEEVVVTAWLDMAGRRLSEGDDLQVERFQLVLADEQGARKLVPLYDSGDEQHGNIRAGDGIWSNCFSFEKEGLIKPSLMVQGSYRGTEFFLEKPLGEFAVHESGSVLVTLTGSEKDLWAKKGGKLVFPLKFQNKSMFTETILLECPEELGQLSPFQIFLEPGETKSARLELSLSEGLVEAVYPLRLFLTAANDLTKVEPAELELGLEVVGAREALLKKLASSFSFLLPAGKIVLVLLAVFWLGGYLLYFILVRPRMMLRGFLTYSKIGEENPKEAAQTLSLSKLKKSSAVISFNRQNKDADFYLEESGYNYDIIISNYLESTSLSFILGWKALQRKGVVQKVIVRCTPPGILQFGKVIFTKRELFHKDKFLSGGFAFQYISSRSKGLQKQKGSDLLEGKI